MEKGQEDFEKILKRIFDTIDSKKEGLITSAETSKLLKSLGVNDEKAELKLLLDSMSKGFDDQISFSELFSWFQQKIANSSDLEIIKEKMLSRYRFLEEQENANFDNHAFRINIGDPNMEFKANLALKLSLGGAAEKEFQELITKLPIQNQYGAFAFIKCKDPKKAQESLKHLIPRLFVWVNDMLPPKAGLDFRKIEHKTIIEGDVLKIWFELKNQNLTELVEQFIKVQSRIIPEELMGFVEVNLKLKKDIEDILEDFFIPNNQNNAIKKDLISHILEGLIFDVSARMSSKVLSKLRTSYFKSKKFLQLPENIRNMAFLLLWKGTKSEISFRKFPASFLEQFFSSKNSSYSVEKILSKLKVILNDFQKKHSIYKPLFLAAHHEFIADIQIGLKIPHILALGELKSKGFQQFYDYTCTE